MVGRATGAAIRRTAGTFALGLAALAAVTLVSLWIGLDSAPTGLLYLIVITLLSMRTARQYTWQRVLDRHLLPCIGAFGRFARDALRVA